MFFVCGSEVSRPCAVGGANFAEVSAGLGHDIRHTESAANLDQLAAGHRN